MPRAEYFGSDAVEIANLQYREAMVLPESGERIVQSILTPLDDSTAEFRFASIGADVADDVANPYGRRGAQGSPARNAQTAPLQLDRIRQRCASSIPIDRYYEALRALGLEYGASFRAIEMLQRGNGEILTRVRLPPHLSVDGQSGLHPALLDACLHLYPALVDAYGDFTRAAEEPRRTYLPVSVERFRCAGSPRPGGLGARRAAATGKRRPGLVTVDIAIYQDDGRFAAAIEGLSLKPLPPEALRPHAATGTVDSSEQAAASRPGDRKREARRGCGGDKVPIERSARSGTPRIAGRVRPPGGDEDIGHHRNDRCGSPACASSDSIR